MLILGIDPGTATTGYGVIKTKGKEVELVDFGLIETDKNVKSGQRLININKEISLLIKKVRPDAVAIEKLFFAANAKTAMSVSQAIGVIIYTVAKSKVEIYEYAPATIKKVISGDGRADKKIMQKALRKLLGAKVKSRAHSKTHFDNSADALAVALCHVYNRFQEHPERSREDELKLICHPPLRRGNRGLSVRGGCHNIKGKSGRFERG